MTALLDVGVLHARDVPGAQEGGADRLWLATEAGMSPDLQVASSVIKETDLPVRVMLRLNDSHTTTGGEFTRLGGLAEEYLALGAEGVAFGFLDPDLEVDVDTCAALADRLTGVPWTFPATIDACLEPPRAWRRLRTLPGLDAVCSAGSPRGLEVGYDDLLALAQSDPAVADRLMPGNGLVAEQVPWLVRAGVHQFHVDDQVRPGGSAKAYVDAALVRSWRLLLGAEVKRTVGTEPYFTAPDLSRRCVDFAASLLDLDAFALMVEPGAGAGAFLRHLPRDRRLGMDIEPRHPAIRRADFLSWRPPAGTGPVLTIGNPPFGQRGALAMRFLDHACGFSDAVAFILPRSFRKWTFENRVDPYFHLAGSFDCEEFHDGDGRARSVRTVFQVWQRQPVRRVIVEPPGSHPDFEMFHAHLSRTDEAERARLRRDYAFTVPQVGADFRPRDVATVTRGSHWFIRPLAAGVRERFERLDFGFLAGMNTAHTSLSKSDIVAAYVATG